MPSSTSNSSDRAPVGAWSRTWLVALLLSAAALAGLELFWRAQGYRPTRSDDAFRWAEERRKLHAGDTTQVAILGSSRMLSAIDPGVFEAQTERRPVQLSIVGAPPQPVLAILGREHFAGLVVCGVTPAIFFDGSGERTPQTERMVVVAERGAAPSAWVDAFLATLTHDHLVFRHPELAPRFVALGVLHGESLRPRTAFGPERQIELNFEGVDFGDAVDPYYDSIAQPLAEPQLAAMLRRVEASVRAIQSRGGRVVFVRMPADKRVDVVERRRFPDDVFWQALVDTTSALTVHTDQVPELKDFAQPDGSHFDSRDKARVTSLLTPAIRAALVAAGDDRLGGEPTP